MRCIASLSFPYRLLTMHPPLRNPKLFAYLEIVSFANGEDGSAIQFPPEDWVRKSYPDLQLPSALSLSFKEMPGKNISCTHLCG
jgi:hypothetical protein